jgi:hypothetical protein
VPLGFREQQKVRDEIHDITAWHASYPAPGGPFCLDVGVKGDLGELDPFGLRGHGRSPRRLAFGTSSQYGHAQPALELNSALSWTVQVDTAQAVTI